GSGRGAAGPARAGRGVGSSARAEGLAGRRGSRGSRSFSRRTHAIGAGTQAVLAKAFERRCLRSDSRNPIGAVAGVAVRLSLPGVALEVERLAGLEDSHLDVRRDVLRRAYEPLARVAEVARRLAQPEMQRVVRAPVDRDGDSRTQEREGLGRALRVHVLAAAEARAPTPDRHERE